MNRRPPTYLGDNLNPAIPSFMMSNPTITKNRHIVVAGDVPIELFVYPSANCNSARHERQISKVHRSDGGARLIGKCLEPWCPEYKIHQPSSSPELDASAITELEIVTAGTHGTTFKVNRRRQLEMGPVWKYPDTSSTGKEKIDILVLQDAMFDFTNPEYATKLLPEVLPELLIYHMVQPLGNRTIWNTVRHGPYDAEGKQYPERLVTIISADDLRAEGIELSYGLSWEKTCEDFVRKIGSNGKLDTLVTCANLVVLFSCDAAIYHRGRQMIGPTLVFDPLGTEGSFTSSHLGDFPGLIETFIGGLVAHRTKAPREDLVECIKYGLGSMRRFAELGLRSTKIHDWPKHPLGGIKASQDSVKSLVAFTIPSDAIARRSDSNSSSKWSILHDNIGDQIQVADRIVKKGAMSATKWVPIARFGDLVLFDRSEIESFRTIFHLVREHLSVHKTRPLNIGVFGSRGSGKSFASVQVVKTAAAASGRTVRLLRFNLAQFSSPEVLSAAFDAVRECALLGELAVVYLNGFDASLAGVQYGWLVHLLPPMHVAQVFDRGEMRHLGPAILLFGSVSTSSFEDFQESTKDGGMQSAEEFLSCLDAYVNVIGINKTTDADEMYPVRRAAVLRALLEGREPKLKGSGGISIDNSVLNGLLLVPRLTHGIRSLRTIISTSKITGKTHFERAALPPADQLRLHLDLDDFIKYSQGNTLPDNIMEDIAKSIHEKYVECRRRMVPNKPDELANDPSLKVWNELSEELKESSRAHAEDVPRKLRKIFCYVALQDQSRSPVTEFSKDEVETLAEEEHERWNAERLQKQWRLGKRVGEQRSSPFLVPWENLSEEWRDIDRGLVRSYPIILPSDYCIYRVTKLTQAEQEDVPGLVHSATM
ncbi:hypothetical protein F4803DRAFT_71636 [Xylaria telfairii]|nr:hypothetical protein F4803DRAFT_71636 [Xylaria telfairii]